MLRFRRAAPWLIGIAAVFMAVPADAQGNIDAGKTPAQIFADTCAACHRGAGSLKRTSVGFLRAHYTTGTEEASAMANYLAGIPSDSRAGQQKRQPTDAAKQNPRPTADQAKGPQGQPKGGRPGATAQARPATEEKPPEPPPTPATPALEPFEE